MSSLPVAGWVAIKVDKKYVRHLREDGEFNNTLQASGDKALTPYTRFYLEPSAKKKELVHIRSRYNNMYWVPKNVKDSWYIFVDAKEPEEDTAQSSCTLFKFCKCTDDPSAFRLQANFEAHPPRCLGATKEGRLFVTSENQGLKFTVITLHVEKSLPTYVRFMGDNNRYLGSDADDVLRFAWMDGNDSRVIHRIDTSPDGSFIRIKSEKSGKFWRCDPKDNYWIAANADSDDNFSRFEVLRLCGNVIALKNIGNGKFAKRFTDRYESGLNAYIDFADVHAQLKLEEAVTARKIYNVQYHMDAARVYDKKTLVMATAHSVNYSRMETTAKLNLKYGVTNTSSWTKTTTETCGVNGSLHAGLPTVSLGTEGSISIGITPDFNINVGGNFEHTYAEEYGGTHTRTEEQSVDYDMKVPPKTKMTLRAITTQVSYDIPYSYIQKDVLADGRRLLTQGEDGLFQGVNYPEFTYEVNEEEVTADKKKAIEKVTDDKKAIE